MKNENCLFRETTFPAYVSDYLPTFLDVLGIKKMMNFAVKMMNFAVKTMNFAVKMMNFAVKTMNFAVKTMNFALKLMTCGRDLARAAVVVRGRYLSPAVHTAGKRSLSIDGGCVPAVGQPLVGAWVQPRRPAGVD